VQVIPKQKGSCSYHLSWTASGEGGYVKQPQKMSLTTDIRKMTSLDVQDKAFSPATIVVTSVSH